MTIVFILFNSFSLAFAKEKEDDTNIVCFAAKNKWVCAPADKQSIAHDKVQQLLKENQSETLPANVVIKPISIPKFQSTNPITKSPLLVNTSKPTKKIKPKTQAPIVKRQTQNENPYAKLWAHQLIGLSTPNSAINFVNKNKLNKNEVLIIKSVRNDMDWWIVLYGLYKDKQTGLDNEVNLPKKISKPWLRPLKNLKVNGFIDEF